MQPVAEDAAQTFIKVRKGGFSYSYLHEWPSSVTGGAPASISAAATGKVITKSRANRQFRVEGTVSVLDWDDPNYGLQNCASGGPLPYSATPCRYPMNPPYIKESLPYCWPDV